MFWEPKKRTEIELLEIVSQRNKELATEVAMVRLQIESVLGQASAALKEKDLEIKRLRECLELEKNFNAS